jgi:DNA processing protein
MSWSSTTEFPFALQICRTTGIGPLTFRQLQSSFSSAKAAAAAIPNLARKGGRQGKLKLCSPDIAEREIERTQALGGKFLTLGAKDYPEALAAIPDAPPIISVYGDTRLLSRPKISIVGARNASAAGIQTCRLIARDIAQRDLVIVSGLARGIDTIAHREALATGTIACIANGADVFYPRENEKLQVAISSQGLLVCENPPGTQPQATQFPRRNRIISGLTMAVVVIEAAKRSGSLITARLSNEYGREVMATPGSPLDPRNAGSNHLIRQGASLVETADDIIEILNSELNWSQFDASEKSCLQAPMTPTTIDASIRKTIYDLLGPTPTEIDELHEISAVPLASLHMALLELDLAGRLTRDMMGRVSLIAS